LNQWAAHRKVPNFSKIGIVVFLLYKLLVLSSHNNSGALKTKGGKISAISSVRSSMDIVQLLRSQNDMSFNEKERIPEEEFVFSLPLYFSLKNSPRYEKMFNQANKTLNYYIKAKLFSFWKKFNYRKIAFVKKQKTRLLSEIYLGWKQYADYSAITRYKLNTHLEKKNKQILKDIFFSFKHYSQKMHQLRKLYSKEAKRRSKLIMRNLLEKWKSGTKENVFNREGNKLAIDFRHTCLLKKSFLGWNFLTCQNKRVSGILFFLKIVKERSCGFTNSRNEKRTTTLDDHKIPL